MCSVWRTHEGRAAPSIGYPPVPLSAPVPSFPSDVHSARVCAGIRVERLENGAEVGVSVAHIRGRFNASRASSVEP
jgi:hypothetical protein